MIHKNESINAIILKRARLVIFLASAIFFGCASAAFPAEEPPAKAASAETKISKSLAKEVRAMIVGLEYSDEVADKFLDLISDWNCDEMKNKISQAKEDFATKKFDSAKLARIEEEVARWLSEKIWSEIEYGDKATKYIDADKIFEDKKTHCFGYSQIFYILGKTAGLSVRIIFERNPAKENHSDEDTHASNLLDLPDGKSLIVDVTWKTVSKKFVFREAFAEDGAYWTLRGKNSLLKNGGKIQIWDQNDLLVALEQFRAETRLEAGKYEEAFAFLDKAIKLDPKSADNYMCRSLVFEKMDKYEEAIIEFNKAIELDLRNSCAYLGRGDAYLRMQKTAEALADFDKAIELDPKYAHAYHLRGYIKALSQQHDDAIVDYCTAIELDPKAVDAYLNRGISYENLGKIAETITDYTKALEIDPKNAEAYFLRGRAYNISEKCTEAIPNLTQAIVLDPKNAKAYSQRGYAFHILSKYDEAIADYTKSLELDPTVAEAYDDRGQAYYEALKLKEALVDLNKAISLNPNLAHAYINMGYVYTLKKQYDESIESYTKAIKLEPQNAVALSCRADVYQTTGKFSEAIDDLTKAIEADPKNAALYHSRGKAHMFLKHSSEAHADFSKVLEQEPANPEALTCRGMMNIIMEKYEEALADLSKALEADSEYGQAYGGRAYAYLKMERFADALADANKAKELGFEDATTYLSRGNAHAALGKKEKAVSELSKAMELEPENTSQVKKIAEKYKLDLKFEDVKSPLFEKNRPDWEIKFSDAENAVMSVMPGESKKKFQDPMSGKEVQWEQDVYSPAFTSFENKLYCAYRTFGNDDEWRLGLAWSGDGTHFTRSDQPLLYAKPSDEFLKPFRKEKETISFGDPHLIAGEDGQFYLFFNFFHFGNTTNDQQLAVAVSRDLRNWKVHGRIFAGESASDRSLIPERAPWRLPVATVVTRLEKDRLVAAKIDGKYWMYFNCYATKGPYCLCMATSENLLDWKVLRNEKGEPVNPLPTRPDYFDSFYTDPVAAVLRKDGILLIYNGVNAKANEGGDSRLKYYAHYPAQALFEKADPSHLLKRGESPFKGGDEELEKQPIVFWEAPLYEAWSLVPHNNELHLYWNHAFGRRSVGLWKAPLSSIENEDATK